MNAGQNEVPSTAPAGRFSYAKLAQIAIPDTPPRQDLTGRPMPLDFQVNIMNVKSDLHYSFHGVNWRRTVGCDLADSIQSLRGVAAYCREIERAIRKEAGQ